MNVITVSGIRLEGYLDENRKWTGSLASDRYDVSITGGKPLDPETAAEVVRWAHVAHCRDMRAFGNLIAECLWPAGQSGMQGEVRLARLATNDEN